MSDYLDRRQGEGLWAYIRRMGRGVRRVTWSGNVHCNYDGTNLDIHIPPTKPTPATAEYFRVESDLISAVSGYKQEVGASGSLQDSATDIERYLIQKTTDTIGMPFKLDDIVTASQLGVDSNDIPLWHMTSDLARPFVIQSALYRLYSDSHSEEKSETVAWNRDSEANVGGLALTVMTGASYYNTSDETLYAYAVDLVIDRDGKIQIVSVERRVIIDVPTYCDT